MTNEKAIDLLRRMQEPEAYEPQITEEAYEALDLAIKALGTDTNAGTTIQPRREERKIGEWIYDWGDWDFETCKCSECGNHMTAPIGKKV